MKRFNPRMLSNLAAFYRSDQGMTVGGTPLAAGTAPPAVTYTGTLTGVPGLFVQIDGAGTGAAATFKWGLNGSAGPFIQTGQACAAAVVLTGLAAAVTVNFPNAAYLTDNTYSARLARWADLSGGGHDLIQATVGLQPLIIMNAVNGYPSVRFDTSGGNTMATGAFTLNNPMAAWMVAKSITYGTAGVKDIWLDGNTLASMVIGSVLLAGYSISSGSAITLAAAVANAAYAYIGNIFGASGAIRVNGTQLQTGNTGASNPGGITLGGLANGTRGSNFEVAELPVYSSTQGAADIARLESYLKARYSL